MRRIFKFILVFTLSLTLIGCGVLDLGGSTDLDPIESNDTNSINLLLESVDGQHRLFVGGTLQLKATLSPNSLEEDISFASNNEAIATIDQTGLVSGISPGRVRITAEVTINEGLFKYKSLASHLYLTVLEEEVELESIEILGQDSLYLGDILKLNLLSRPENASLTGEWKSSNEEIAIVDQQGRLSALAVGDVNISYFVNESIQDTLKIKVLKRTGNPTEITLFIREKVEVGDVLIPFIETIPQGSLNEVAYSVSDENILKVDESGKIIALNAGVALVYAKTPNNLVASQAIEVIDYKIDKNDLEAAFIQLIETRKDSVLGVSNYKRDKDGDLVPQSIGSGFVYKLEFHLKDGSIISDINKLRSFSEVSHYKYYLITNRHVVEGSDALKIYLSNVDQYIDATLIQYDNMEDVAVVVFDYSKYIRPLEFADSNRVKAGSYAIAIGNPNSFEFSDSATRGMISHSSRFLPTDTDNDGINDWDAEYIQHDVAINPGNSGGPLFNLDGDVIGVNTLKFAATNVEGMGFSIPSNVVVNLLPYLEEGERPQRAKIGITIVAVRDILMDPKSEYEVPEEVDYGLYVIDVSENSVASLGGVEVGDIIIKFNETDLFKNNIIRAELGQIVVGSKTEVEVLVYRAGEFLTLYLVF